VQSSKTTQSLYQAHLCALSRFVRGGMLRVLPPTCSWIIP